nr:alpha-hydroxy acid oxidase [Actinoplanes teichomyceticus]
MEDFERSAAEALPGPVWDFVSGGAGDERTVDANRTAFAQVRLTPRILMGVAEPDPSTRLFGRELSMPVAVAPMAYQELMHPDGEPAVVRAAAAAGVPFTVATLGSRRLEELADLGADLWFQLYWLRDRGRVRELLARAEQAGCRCVMLTVDTPRLGRRLRDMRNGFALPASMSAANLVDPLQDLSHTGVQGESAVARHSTALLDPSLSWRDLDWLRQNTGLPLVLKGVLDARDAAQAARAGVDGLVVSNHGGRQFDAAPASLSALPDVVAAVGDTCPVLLDSGVRSGSDVLKALALGASGVLVGRPVLWALAAGGERGVARLLSVLHAELVDALALAGCPAVGPARELRVRLPECGWSGRTGRAAHDG